ncbi:MAG: CBS domain-containing protein [Thermoproteota archaeon]|nr:CBS domain-containing protein [Thermoproteota archaeon]
MVVTSSMLKRLRTEAGLTQRQLAQLAGVSQAHIAKIEGGKVDPRLSTVNKILQVLTCIEGKKCQEIMTKKVICARPNDKVLKVSQIMMKNAVSQLPVTENGRVVGTVTEESIIRNLSSSIADEKVKKIMEPPLPSTPENTSISTIRSMLENHPGVLVMKRGEVVGIITRSDILKTI